MVMKLHANTMVCASPDAAQNRVELGRGSDLVGWMPVDLNGDGIDSAGDGLLPLKEDSRIFCGLMEETEFAAEVGDRFGMGKPQKVENGFAIIGTFWRARAQIDIKKNATVISYSYLGTEMLSLPGAAIKAPNLGEGKLLHLDDKVTIAKFENEWTVFKFNAIKEAIALDGEKATVNTAMIEIMLVNEEGMKNIKAGKRPSNMDVKIVTVGEITGIIASPAKAEAAPPKPKG